MAKINKKLLLVNSLNIWTHQKNAVKDIVEYIDQFENKSFLVKMPTGTGKTGVFSVLSRIASPELNYIIITPSTALKFQIIEEIRSKFWEKIGKDVGDLPEQVILPLLPKDAADVVNKIKDKNFILVTTIQALQTIASKDEPNFLMLQKFTGCIIFDEGHKEPAYTWGETVRSFKKPTVLFSATPYRNDYKVFKIDKKKFFSLEHSFCVKQNILREIKILPIKVQTLTTATFVNELLAQIHKITPELTEQGISNPKVIIRCENSQDIEKITKSLKSLKKRAVGIHQNFDDINDLYSDVPNVEKQKKYDFFIHQFKLIEGIDNPEFCIVAIYSDFGSSRLLIQQVGRVLRNPTLKPKQSAFLFCLDDNAIKNEWKKYLLYDKMVDERKQLFDVTDVLSVNKDASTLYFDGAFRDLVNVNNLDLPKNMLFQKKINVFFQEGSLTFTSLSEQLLEEWDKRDYSILKHEVVEGNKLLILYIKYENSPLVKDGVFIEQTLGLTFLRFDTQHIFYYDSIQNNPMRQIEELTPVSRENLIKLFKDKRNISKIFLMNTDIGGRNVRNKELQASSVEYTAPGLADHSFFPQRLEGNVKDGGETRRRYVGFQNGRITDATSGRITFEEMQIWIDEINSQLLAVISSSGIHGFLNRFAQKSDPPQNPEVTSILLDIEDEIQDNYLFFDGTNKHILQIDDLCASVENNTFSLEINGNEFEFNIGYQSDQKRFFIQSTETESFILRKDEDDPSLIGYLNSNQSFRVVLKGNEFVYAYKNFFRPGLNLISKKKDLDLNQIFFPHQCISKIKSEKGGPSKLISSNLWHKDTLFGLIARRAKGYGDVALENICVFEYLLCDDLGGEIGDFIALNTKTNQVVFIHAKAKKAKLSATSFQEICGQATKNLDYLTPYFDKTPSKNIAKWGKPWNDGKIGIVPNRVVHGNIKPKAFWDKYTTLMSNPATSREVWMFVGNMFDYASFKKEINKNKISDVKPEVIQMVYLLRSTWNSVASVGAQLKIFC